MIAPSMPIVIIKPVIKASSEDFNNFQANLMAARNAADAAIPPMKFMIINVGYVLAKANIKETKVDMLAVMSSIFLIEYLSKKIPMGKKNRTLANK